MRMRDAGRWILIFAALGVVSATIAACGGAGSSDTGGSDASVNYDGPGSFGQRDSSVTTHNNCIPKSCADQGFNCGPNSDGCGGPLMDCGTCPAGQMCGVGGFSKCGDPTVAADGGPLCKPKTCADFPTGTCGQQTDGCGGLTASCGSCTSPQYCGGGGPSLCGGDVTKTPDGSMPCTPQTCTSLGYNCGQASDGCGGTVGPCGSCTSPQYCGASASNQCGGNNGMGADGGSLFTCTPKGCAAQGANCGQLGDGCGGVTPVCGSCTNPQYCGGGGDNVCGGSNGLTPDGGLLSTCVPKTCADFSGKCGPQGDGCGGMTANCGTCPSPQYCGGGGPGVCGGNVAVTPDGGVNHGGCVPATCASLGYNCGQAVDGCGDILTCGSGGTDGKGCFTPQACGAVKANVCGSNIPCTNLCLDQVACDSGSTTLSGIVVAGTLPAYLPSGATVGDPVPNVLVYVPNAPVTAFTSRHSESAAQRCSTCGADVSGSPLVTATTAFDGTFTLTNVPVGTGIPLVIQLGRWRRQFSVNITNSCGPNTLNATGTSKGASVAMPTGYLVMPRNKTEGDIPLTALSTGAVDAMECVLLKMGVDAAEFTSNSGTGRIQLFHGNGANGPGTNTPMPEETALMGSGGTYNDYDQIILPCWGVDPVSNTSNRKSTTELANLATYGDGGGHFFATHFSYTWLTQTWNTPNNGYGIAAANWDLNANTSIPSTTGIVSQVVPPAHPGTFVNWLNKIQALSNATAAPPAPNPADVALSTVRHDVDSVAGKSVDWIDGTDPNGAAQMLLHFTFDTPVNAASQCGHAIFSDFHVTNQTDTSNFDFTNTGNRNNECPQVPMTPQEKILEYMIWDLSSCVPPPPTSNCTPKTCAAFPGTCGQQSDGCGGLTMNCGTCGVGQTCGGAGVANQCGTPDGGACTPFVCASYPVGTCGPQSDGCGGLTANCANCPTGTICGGGGVANQCGAPPSGSCTPKTCAAYPANTCGAQSDGCGGLTPDCHPCTPPATCGGGGTPGMCGTPPTGSCTPKTCADYPAGTCGQQSDGCGGLTPDCHPCTPPDTCGGGGTPGQCGNTGHCTPLTCAQQGISCGPAGDGCGGTTQSCGMCTPPMTCGGGGTPGVCGGNRGCMPQTCQSLNINCGPAGDGCGGVIDSCGTCAPPASCGGGGAAGQCGMSIPK